MQIFNLHRFLRTILLSRLVHASCKFDPFTGLFGPHAVIPAAHVQIVTVDKVGVATGQESDCARHLARLHQTTEDVETFSRAKNIPFKNKISGKIFI